MLAAAIWYRLPILLFADMLLDTPGVKDVKKLLRFGGNEDADDTMDGLGVATPEAGFEDMR